jgi:imidazolonepropionase-like amidohydrolase
MGIAAIIRENLFKCRQYTQKQQLEQKKMVDGGEPKFDKDFKMEALSKVLDGKVKCRFHCHKSHDIMTALRIADEFGLDITFEHCTEGIKIIDEIAKRNFPVVLSPLMNARGKYETKDRSWESPVMLTEAGVLVAISTDGISQQARWLPLNAGIAVRYGLKEEDAFKAVTINAAKIIGVEDRVGTLEKGKDADILITDGHPFEATTKTAMVIISGNIQFKNKDLFPEG